MAKSNVMLDDLFGQTQSLMVPFVQLNQLAVARLDKLVEFQLDALQSYVDLGLERMKAAAALSSLEDLQDFFQGQMEAAKSLQQMLLNDFDKLMKLTVSTQAEFGKLAEDSAKTLEVKLEAVMGDVKDSAAKAVKETKAAAQKAS